MGTMKFYWSGKPSEEDLGWIRRVPDIRKDLSVCDDCGAKVDCAVLGDVSEQEFQQSLDMIRQYLAHYTQCGQHHLPPWSK